MFGEVNVGHVELGHDENIYTMEIGQWLQTRTPPAHPLQRELVVKTSISVLLGVRN